MTALAKHTTANREFFAKGSAPSIHQWIDWVRRGVVRGKVIDGKPYIDLNHFAVNDVLEAAPPAPRLTGLDLLRPGKAA